MGLHEPGLNRLIRAAYDLLGLQTYFTAGVKEARAWTIHKGDTAPRPPGLFTATSNGASSARKPLLLKTLLASRGSRAPRRLARCVPRARNTLSGTATS